MDKNEETLQIIVALIIVTIIPVGGNVYAQEDNVIYNNDIVTVYQNDDGSKTAIVSIPDDVQQGDSVLVYRYS
ncbi:MAG: hypothetical protein Q4C64_03300 [Erysipelotrichia bacterium]|nr:hypothetical protein [Erysipelotrichia bacterium]